MLWDNTIHSLFYTIAWHNKLKKKNLIRTLSGELGKSIYKKHLQTCSFKPSVISIPSSATIPNILSLWIQLPVMLQSSDIVRCAYKCKAILKSWRFLPKFDTNLTNWLFRQFHFPIQSKIHYRRGKTNKLLKMLHAWHLGDTHDNSVMQMPDSFTVMVWNFSWSPELQRC